jgi:hypothetical protein
MKNNTKNTAENSPFIKLHLKLLESRFRTVKGSLEMLTVFKHPNLKSAACMIEDCELLLEAARELHQAMSKNEVEFVFDPTSPSVGLYTAMNETQGQTANTGHSIQQPEPTISDQEPQSKSELEFTFKDAARLAKERLENHQKRKAEFAGLKTKDWAQLFLIKSEKAYKGLQVTIDDQQNTISTFKDYCLYAVGLSYRSVMETLKFLQEMDEVLFTALNALNIRVIDMRTCCKLSAEQKQALLQIAQTGDKAATLAFIQQALPAGE